MLRRIANQTPRLLQARHMATVAQVPPLDNPSYQKIVPDSPGMETFVGGLVNLLCSPLHLIGNGFVTVEPMHVSVLTYFGKYNGQHLNSGLNWIPTPIGMKACTVYMGARTTDLKKSKIIDRDGNPVVVSGIMNYNVSSPEQYVFGVDNSKIYIYNQAEKVLKQVVSEYTYDELKQEGSHIRDRLMTESQNVLNVAGINVTDFSLTDMNYASEIAQAMLVRQQAGAYIKAREEVTMAACDIVDDVIKKFDGKMDEKAQAELIKNLLVVITSNSNVQPVINVSN
jgi:hypothetical protein